MHIPDAYLSPSTQAATFAVMVPLWIIAAKKTRAKITTRQAPLLAMGAAFSFAVQMFNLPAIGGTTAHALGTVFMAILLGPWTSLLAISLTLLIQALFFGDGGVLSFGANALSMACVASFVGSGVYHLLRGQASLTHRNVFAAAAAGYIGIVAASLSAGTILGIQPWLAHDALGHALYFPFGLSVSVPAMVSIHMLVAGPAEAVVTASALAYVWRNFPDLKEASRTRRPTAMRLARPLAICLCLTPLGLLASGNAWGEWELETIKGMIGYAPKGVVSAPQIIHPLLPDYAIAGLSGHSWEIVGYLLSAFVGAGLVALATRGLVGKTSVRTSEISNRPAPTSELPDWMNHANVPLTGKIRAKKDWFEGAVSCLRASIEMSIRSEKIARLDGWMQRQPPIRKVVGLGVGLIATALAPTSAWLLGFLTVGFVLAFMSQIPFSTFAKRTVGGLILFGSAAALPMSLRAVTPGPAIGGTVFSVPGVAFAALLLLRMACAISITQLITTTTRWDQMIMAFRKLGVPMQILQWTTLTYRYLFVLLDVQLEMLTARKSRQVGAATAEQAREFAGAGTGILFAKSLALSEETHLAMASRTLLKTPPPTQIQSARWQDLSLGEPSHAI